MKYDNERDRTSYGYDAGSIIEGDDTLDPNTGEYVIVDEEGVAFSSQSILKSLLGQRVRLTCISFEAIQNIQNMLAEADRGDLN